VDLTDDTGLLSDAIKADLTRLLTAAGRELDAPGELRLRVVHDPVMTDLHQRHTNVPGTTDVLTFDLRPMGLGPVDADIVVCLDEARRQALTRGHAPERELLLYAVHGLLHCLGHDDHDDDAYQHMHAAEDRLLTALGVGPVFGAPALTSRVSDGGVR
jgi:probable rRNA maturation factor